MSSSQECQIGQIAAPGLIAISKERDVQWSTVRSPWAATDAAAPRMGNAKQRKRGSIQQSWGEGRGGGGEWVV